MNLGNKIRLGWSVLRYKFTGKRIPVAVAWMITGRCNAYCVYCKWKHERQGEELDTAVVKGLIDQMRHEGVRLISFTGGEPLVRDDMGQIIRHVKSLGLVCKLNTNGILVPSKLADLKPLDLLQISVDGPPGVHERLRGEGSVDSATQAIEAAQGAGIKVELVACLTQDNVARLDDVLDFALDLGVGYCFQLLTSKYLNEEETQEAVPEPARLIEALEYLVTLKRDRHPRARAIASKASELGYYIDQLKNATGGCDCPPVTATMMPDGRLIFCGNAKICKSHDAVELGFAEAFSRLTIPDCELCGCVGKLRLAKVYKLDLSVIKDLLES